MRLLFLTLAAVSLSCRGLHADEEAKAAPHPVVESEVRSLAPFSGRLTGSEVRMRTQPSLDGHIVSELERGDLLIVGGECNDFYAVTPPDGTKVYVYRTYVLDGRVDGSHVNVRLAPDTDAPIVSQLNTGDAVDGSLVPGSTKWLEIDPPAGVHFFVAKEFVEKIGGPELVAGRGKRIKEAGHLLNSAYMISQAELSKPFPQINLERVTESFEKVLNDYSDLQAESEKASRVLEMVRDVYGQKKAEFLESRVADARTVWDSASAAISGEFEELREAGEGLEGAIRSIPCDELQDESEGELLIDLEEGVERQYPLEAPAPRGLAQSDPKTDRMRAWEPVEDSLYHLWAMGSDEGSKSSFYAEQLLDEVELTGVIEAYDRPVQNRPGDYLLKLNHRPVAFLYSTSVDLEKKAGQRVTLRAVERPNHNFAFPAYFVTSVE